MTGRGIRATGLRIDALTSAPASMPIRDAAARAVPDGAAIARRHDVNFRRYVDCHDQKGVVRANFAASTLEKCGPRRGRAQSVRHALRRIALCAALAVLADTAQAVDFGFPFGQELLLDVAPMKGSKQVPSLEVEANGRGSVDLWCNSLTAQFVVAGATLTILTGTKTTKQCDPDRMRGDDEMLSALLRVTSWRRDGDILVLDGGTSLRFRTATN